MGDEDTKNRRSNEGQGALSVENRKEKPRSPEVKSFVHPTDPDYGEGLISTISSHNDQVIETPNHSSQPQNLTPLCRVDSQCDNVTQLNPTSHVSQTPEFEMFSNCMAKLSHSSLEPKIDALQRTTIGNAEGGDRLVIFGQMEMKKLTEEAKARKRNRLSFFNRQRMRILRLSTNGHLPEELKTMQWCVLCGGKKDGYRGKKASYRCAACAKPLCTRTPYKKQGGNEKSCWVIWHTTDQLKNRTYNHPLARTSYLDESLHDGNINRSVEGNELVNDPSSAVDDNKEDITNDSPIIVSSKNGTDAIRGTVLNDDDSIGIVSKLDGNGVSTRSLSHLQDRELSTGVNQPMDHTATSVSIRSKKRILEKRNKLDQNDSIKSKSHLEEKGSDDEHGVVRCEPDVADIIKTTAKPDELGLFKRPRIT